MEILWLPKRLCGATLQGPSVCHHEQVVQVGGVQTLNRVLAA